MQHKMGLWSLVAVGLGSIIGSGWLFSASRVASYAGSLSIFSWVLGGFIALMLGLMIAEISTLHPKRGLFTRLLTLSHNRDMGYLTALTNWLGVVATIPTEAMATVQYLAHLPYSWTQHLFINTQLSVSGLGLASLLAIGYTALNFWGVRLFAKSNNFLTLFKLIVPVIIALAIMGVAFHGENFIWPTHHWGVATRNIFVGTIAGGVIFAFNGFQTIASFCAEAKDPTRNVPRALIITIFIGLGLFILLQVAFLGALSGDNTSRLAKQVMESPFVQLTTLLGLHVMSLLLYISACVSPSGAGIVYAGATSRMLTAMAQEKQAPRVFTRLHPRWHFSRYSLLFNLILVIGLLWLFPSWSKLVVIVSLFNVVAYMACPLALMRLRISTPEAGLRHFTFKPAFWMCPLVFILMTFLFSLTPEKDLILVSSVMLVFYLIYLLIAGDYCWQKVARVLQRSYMMILYFITLTLLGLLANPIAGGLDLLSHTTFYSLTAGVSLLFYIWIVYYPPNASVKETVATTSS